MYYIFPQSNIIKLQDIAVAFKLLKEGKVNQIGMSTITTQSTLNQSFEKAQLANEIISTFIQQQNLQDKIYNADELLAVSNMKFYEILMHQATKESIEQSEEQMKLQNVQYKDLSKVLPNAACSYIPSILRSMCQLNNINELYSVYNIQNNEQTTYYQEQITVQPLKANPRNMFEEISAYVLLEDTCDSLAKKINKGFCEDKNVENNPVLDQLKLCQCFVDVNYDEIKQKFANGEITPQELKKTVIDTFKLFWKDNADLKKKGDLLRKK